VRGEVAAHIARRVRGSFRERGRDFLRHGRADPAIHVFVSTARKQDVDARDKRGHDDRPQIVDCFVAEPVIVRATRWLSLAMTAPKRNDCVPRMLRSAPRSRRGALLIRGPSSSSLSLKWVPAQRSGAIVRLRRA
jgi:hypothetical protein